MSRYRDSDYDDEYRSYKQPRTLKKDSFNKHKKAIYDMIDNEEDDLYFTEDYSYDEDFEEE
jgi:hypothetical protein